jgi:hypothetical protein
MAQVGDQEITDRYAIYHADCMDVLRELPNDSIGATVYSPPFGGLYHYSSDDRDLSNARDYDEFFEMYRFVIDEIFRVTIPGRCSGVHASLVPSVASASFGSYIDFPGDVIRAHQSAGSISSLGTLSGKNLSRFDEGPCKETLRTKLLLSTEQKAVWRHRMNC